MKKTVLSLALAAAMAVSLTACGGSSGSSSGTTAASSQSTETTAAESTTSGTTASETTAAVSTAPDTTAADTAESGSSSTQTSGDTVTLKIATILTSGEPAVLQMQAFADRVNEKSGGSLNVQVYPDGSLYSNAQDIIETIRNGGNVIAFADPAQLADYVPDYAIMCYPYIFNSSDDIEKVGLSSWGQEQVEAAAEQGIRVLDSMTTYFGTRDVISTKKFTNLEEFKGIKCRVPTTPIWVSTFNALGADTQTLSWSEVYSALSQGVVEAAENPLPSIESAKLQEVAKYCMLTEHMIAPGGLEMSEQLYQTLTDEQKQILTDEALQFAKDTGEAVKQKESEVREELEGDDVEFVEIDKEEFKAACADIYKEYDWTEGAYQRVQNIVAGTED